MEAYNPDGINDCLKCDCLTCHTVKYVAFGFRKGKMRLTCTRCGYKWYKLSADSEKENFWDIKNKTSEEY